MVFPQMFVEVQIMVVSCRLTRGMASFPAPRALGGCPEKARPPFVRRSRHGQMPSKKRQSTDARYTRRRSEFLAEVT